MNTERPEPIEKFNPTRFFKSLDWELLRLYKEMYIEYVKMIDAYARLVEHTDSVEKRMLEAIKQSDHWYTQYRLLLKKNERLQMPTEGERRRGTLDSSLRYSSNGSLSPTGQEEQ